MCVVGGGVIGLELGSVYQRLGTDVTVIQHTERICPFLDIEVGKSFQNILKKQGLKFLLNTRVKNGINNKEKGIVVNLEDSVTGAPSKIEVDIALISIGRHAFTGGLQLDKAGLKTTERGLIEINETWQT